MHRLAQRFITPGREQLERTRRWLHKRLRKHAIARFFSKHRARIEPPIHNLSASIPQLKALSDTLEDRFVKIGESIEKQSALSSTLVKQSQTLLNYVIGRVGGESQLQDTIAMLAAPLAFIEDCNQRSTQLITRLKHHKAQLEGVRELEQSLHNTIAPLKFIQTLFKVESATLPVEVQNIFMGLTKDIEQLHQKVTEIFGEQFQALAQSHETIGKLILRMESHISIQTQSTADRKALINASIQRLQEDMRDNQTRDVRLTQASQNIVSQVGRIVIGLQFHDITRQKLEHVAQALSELETRMHELIKPGFRLDTTDADRGLSYIKDTCALQASHLLSVQDDLTQAEQVIRLGLETLRTNTCDLDQECVSLNNFKSVSAADDGMVQTLINIIADMRQVLSSSVQIQEEVYQTVRPLGGLASNLTGVMRQLSANIKLIALNAQIQAAHVGNGTGLEVLAESTCRISDETYEFNESTAADLDAFIWGLEQIITECAEVCEQGRTQQQTLDVEGAAVEAKLHAFRDATLNALLEVGVTTANIEMESTLAIELASFQEVTTRHVNALFEPMRILSETCGELLAENLSETSPEQVSHLKKNYTMASERAVHEAFASGQSGALASIPAKPDQIESFDASLDNVNDAPVATTPPLPDAAHEEHAAKLKDRAQPTLVVAKKDITEMTDNIELF